MRIITKILSIFLVCMLFVSGVYADESPKSSTQTQGISNDKNMTTPKGRKKLQKIPQRKKIIQKQNKQLKNTFQALPQNLQDRLNDARQDFQNEKRLLLGESETSVNNIQGNEEKREKLKELTQRYYQKLIEILPADSQALQALKQKKSLYEGKKAQRNSISAKRKNFRINKRKLIMKYRMNFLRQMGNKIERIPYEKLEKLGERIDKFIEKYGVNSRVSEERKEAILSQLEALKELINERLSTLEDTEDMQVLESILESTE